MRRLIPQAIKHSCLMACYWMMGSLTLGGAVPDDANPRDMAVALQTALKKANELNKDIEIMRNSINTYIPFDFSLNGPSENSVLFDTSIIPQESYDFLFVVTVPPDKTCKIVWLEEQKLHMHEFKKTRGDLYDKSAWCVELTKKNAEELIRLMQQYKASNPIHQPISAENIALVRDLTSVYLFDSKDIYTIYGLDSQIFGIVFGQIFIPEQTLSFEIHGLFENLFAYVNDVRNKDIDRDDVLWNQNLANWIKETQLNIKKLESSRPAPAAKSMEGKQESSSTSYVSFAK